MISGALGGLASGINMVIYNAESQVAVKLVLNIVTGLAAFVIRLAVAVAIHSRIG